MAEDVETELSALVSAFRAHLEWAADLGTLATPASDETWLQARRAQYRALVVEPEASTPDTEHVLAPAVPIPQGLGTQGVGTQGLSTQGAGPHATPATTSADPRPTSPSLAAPARAAPPPVSNIPLTERSSTRPRVEPPSVLPVAVQPVAVQPVAVQPVAVQPGAVQPVAVSTAGVLPVGAEARSRLVLLEQEVKGCVRCRLHETRTNTVFARGQGTSGVCFVGEGPGADEDLQGFPFVGAAGQLLDRMIAAMGLERDEVYVCNIVKCRPPQNRKPMPDEMDACQSHLDEQLQLLSPRVIVALGATAVSGLLGVGLSITRLRGNWRLYRGKIPVMPTFHPSYLLRQPAAKREVWNDLLLVLDQLGRPRPAPRK